jgi:RHS repeat-associated protein
MPVSVQPGQTTNYTLTVTNAAGTSATSSKTVNVLSSPNALVSLPAYVTAAQVNYQASVPGVSGNTYAWSITGGTITGNSGSLVYFTPGAAGGTVTLTCTVTNAAGVAQTGSGTAQIVAVPSISSVLACPANIAPGGTSALTATFSNGTGVIDSGVGPVTSGTPVSVQPGQTTAYALTVTNAAGTSTSQSATVTLVPLTLNLLPPFTNLPYGFNLLFIAINTLGQSEPVVWSVAEPGGGTISSTGVYAAPSMAGVYHVNAVSTVPLHAGLSATATVTVPLQVTIAPEQAELLPSETKSFTASITGTTDTRIAWSIQEGSSGGTVDIAGHYTAPATNGLYHVVATSMANPASTAIATVKVGSGMVTVSVAPNTVSLAKGATQAFTATVDGSSQGVIWSASGGTIDGAGNYTAPALFGTYTVTATSVDNPNVRDEATVVVSGGTGTGSFTYDLNGNLTGDGSRTFEWDAENRLVAVVILASGHRSEFGYDELGRRVEIIEKDPDATQTLQISSDKKYLWDGVEIAEERDATGGIVQKRFYSQGFVDTDGTILFYTRDHLGSIRELTDSTQAVRARYDYDPYGRMTKVQGDKDSVFGYAGYFWHSQSGLDLTLYRAYDPNLGRWISRDPLEEAGGINLYGYVWGNPTNLIDSLGLSAYDRQKCEDEVAKRWLESREAIANHLRDNLNNIRNKWKQRGKDNFQEIWDNRGSYARGTYYGALISAGKMLAEMIGPYTTIPFNIHNEQQVAIAAADIAKDLIDKIYSQMMADCKCLE